MTRFWKAKGKDLDFYAEVMDIKRYRFWVIIEPDFLLRRRIFKKAQKNLSVKS